VSNDKTSESPERPEEQVEDERTPITLSYGGASQVVSDESGSRLTLFTNRQRPPVRLRGKIREPLLVREALSCLYDVVSSDFRYVPKDRTAYMAYQRMKKASAGLSAWQAQQAYFEWMSRNDPLAWLILDPVVTVHPDALLFEVFSKDEGTYAQLAIDWSAIEVEGDKVCGTTNIDYSKGLFDGVQRMRSYRDTRIDIGDDAVSVATQTPAGEESSIEKTIKVPDTWLRGFLQVQSAATLPTTVVEIAAIDLYNVLRKLRLNADQKKKGRGIRIELVPGEAPRLVLEPWEEVLKTDAGPYKGKTPAMIRIWGRRRLMLLRRLLPFVESVELHLLGSGLPSFYVLRAGAVRLTLGLSGFTSANWAQAVAFDLLLPRGAEAGGDKDQHLAAVMDVLGQRNVASVKELASATKLKKGDLLRALQRGCQSGQVMYDLAAGVYRHRPLLEVEVDRSRLEYRNLRERVAHDLIAAGAVKIEQESRVFGVGLEVTGEVAVKADRREYRPKMTLDDDGRVRKAECTCSFYRKHKLKEGPCAHLIALRVKQAIEEQRRREARGSSRTKVVVETRTYARRADDREEVVQLALDRQRVKLRWGERGARLRVQSLVFNTIAEARTAFFARADELVASGYLDEAAV